MPSDAAIEVTLTEPDDSGEAATKPMTPIGGLCDGVSEPKLIVSIRGGPGTLASFYFGHEFGIQFLVVDGRCHYYVLRYDMQGLREGDLSARELEQITRELRLDHLSSLPSNRDECVDHWDEVLIATREQSLRCICGESASSMEANDAMLQGRAWLDRLADAGSPVLGRLRAAAVPIQPQTNPRWPIQTVLAWPLEAPLHRIDGLTGKDWEQREGVTFTRGDARALRELRDRTRRMFRDEGGSPYTTYVSECGVSYQLELRERLPAQLERQLAEFLPMAWSRPKIASCRTWSSDVPETNCPPAD